MTLAAILVPHWVSLDVPVHDSDKTYSQHLGLHHYCNTALDKPCRTFPETEKDCVGDDNFCSMWRTSGFLMSFATVAELATLVCFVVTIGGGKVKREYGWKVLSGLLATVAVVQFVALGLVVGYRRGHVPETCIGEVVLCDLNRLTQVPRPGIHVRKRHILRRARLATRYLLDSLYRECERRGASYWWPGIISVFAAARR